MRQLNLTDCADKLVCEDFADQFFHTRPIPELRDKMDLSFEFGDSIGNGGGVTAYAQEADVIFSIANTDNLLRLKMQF